MMASLLQQTLVLSVQVHVLSVLLLIFVLHVVLVHSLRIKRVLLAQPIIKTVYFVLKLNVKHVYRVYIMS